MLVQDIHRKQYTRIFFRFECHVLRFVSVCVLFTDCPSYHDYNPLSGLLSVLGESLAELHHGSRSTLASHSVSALLLLCLIATAFR
jgi:hypothetical protein